MKTIEELTIREQRLIRLVENAEGTIEQKYAAIEALGVFDEYKIIHREYAALSSMHPEALKRAVFLYWYLCVEPPCYTGLNDLCPDAISITMENLNTSLQNGVVDYELNWMLSYYFVWDYVFRKFQYLDSIAKLLMVKESDLPKIIDKNFMTQRGQMGNYWNSLTVFH